MRVYVCYVSSETQTFKLYLCKYCIRVMIHEHEGCDFRLKLGNPLEAKL